MLDPLTSPGVYLGAQSDMRDKLSDSITRVPHVSQDPVYDLAGRST